MVNSSERDKANEIYRIKKYFALAIDPIHVGTGGYRIGRVDNTIVREPATGIPKIPGTTIEGCCRSYAYLILKENGKSIRLACAKGKPKGDREEEQPCGNCEICVTFGYSRKDKSMQAMALFSDARILFFPVATMIGPVWVTCPTVLREAKIKENNNNDIPEPEGNKFIVPEVSTLKNTKISPPENKLNFGWLLLKQDTNKSTNIDNWIHKEEEAKEPKKLSDVEILKDILTRLVIVPDDLFATIVNSNLEVRTSVAIDPERGAVEEGALFTYEAIPRGTVFWFDVIYQNPKNFQMNGQYIESIVKTVEDGFSLFEYLRVGGMGSRGFGRLKVLNLGDKNDGE